MTPPLLSSSFTLRTFLLSDLKEISERLRSMTVLPRYAVLKSKYNNQYLRYIHEDVTVHGFVQFSGVEAVNPYAKFEVERAEKGDGLVHLRCCYNNKYLTRWSENHWWITAGANEPEEDQSKWSCTLFKPVFPDTGTVRLLHVQLGHYACLWRIDPPFGDCLFAGDSNIDKDECDVCVFVDWESLLVLPKHVAFKGNNGRYLGVIWDSHPYLQFSSTDVADPRVGHQIFTTPDGRVRIKSDYSNQFWRRSPNWIWADSDDTSNNNLDTLFSPVKVGNNVVALRNCGNNYFCKRLTTDGMESCLNAAVSTITNEARMDVEELVISRQIYNVKFRLFDARMYDQSVIVMTNGTATNNTEVANTAEVTLSYTDKRTNSWNASVSLKVGVETTIDTGIPLIVDGQIKVSAEFTGAYQWGTTDEHTSDVETKYTVPVPPMSIVTVNLIATKGSCDVPFSYTQRDVLTNGDQVSYEMDDGVYTGANLYHFEYKTEQKNL